jgi:hypothetical protein
MKGEAKQGASGGGTRTISSLGGKVATYFTQDEVESYGFECVQRRSQNSALLGDMQVDS